MHVDIYANEMKVACQKCIQYYALIYSKLLMNILCCQRQYQIAYYIEVLLSSTVFLEDVRILFLTHLLHIFQHAKQVEVVLHTVLQLLS